MGLAVALLIGGAAPIGVSERLPVANAAPTEEPLPASLDIASAEATFLQLLNADRLANGLEPLAADPELMGLARWRSEDMVARDYFAHDIGGYMVFNVMHDREIGFVRAAENLALNNYDDSQGIGVAERSLMSSPTHRENIVRPEFNLVGVGIARGSNRITVYTQLFLERSPDRPPRPAA